MVETERRSAFRVADLPCCPSPSRPCPAALPAAGPSKGPLCHECTDSHRRRPRPARPRPLRQPGHPGGPRPGRRPPAARLGARDRERPAGRPPLARARLLAPPLLAARLRAPRRLLGGPRIRGDPADPPGLAHPGRGPGHRRRGRPALALPRRGHAARPRPAGRGGGGRPRARRPPGPGQGGGGRALDGRAHREPAARRPAHRSGRRDRGEARRPPDHGGGAAGGARPGRRRSHRLHGGALPVLPDHRLLPDGHADARRRRGEGRLRLPDRRGPAVARRPVHPRPGPQVPAHPLRRGTRAGRRLRVRRRRDHRRGPGPGDRGRAAHRGLPAQHLRPRRHGLADGGRPTRRRTQPLGRIESK